LQKRRAGADDTLIEIKARCDLDEIAAAQAQ
jgi:hypothetical protein